MNRIYLQHLRYLPLLNRILLVLLLSLGIASGLFLHTDPKRAIPPPPSLTSEALPLAKWGISERVYDHLPTEGLFAIKTAPPTYELPDLTHIIQFFGKNQRPDALDELYIGIAGHDALLTTYPHETVYLLFAKHDLTQHNAPSSPVSYQFSPHNTPTALMMHLALLNEHTLQVTVELRHPSLQDHLCSTFTLCPTEPPLSSYKLDPALLMKHKARWFGKDCFLREFGGKEFADLIHAERIEFSHDAQNYVCYCKEHDLLIYDQGYWKQPHSTTRGYPLLVLNKVEETSLLFDLWDPLGVKKVPVTLLKTQESYNIRGLCNQIRFLGAKTWGQFAIEVQGQKLLVKPNEWLVFSNNTWNLLDSAEKVEAFVQGQWTGPLLVIESIIKKEGHQTLVTRLFSPSKSFSEKIELIASSSYAFTKSTPLDAS